MFLQALYPGACNGYNSDNLFASVTLAMAIEESGWGTSDLAINAFNYFGQKWSESSPFPYYINPLDGIKYVKYPDPQTGATGLLLFLKQYDRYQDVFNASSPREQITKIQQAGYNPDPAYVNRIIQLVEQNNLTVYDVIVSSGGGDFNGYKSFDNAYGKGWLCPVKGGTVTSKYGWRIHPITGVKTFHHGTDIGVPLNTDYIASKDGVVHSQGFSSSMGNYIYIVHDNKYVTRVMHLNQILTKVGDIVQRGQIIGKAGTTGQSTGVHSHWEIRTWSNGTYGDSTDPAPPLKKGDKV
ncbi:MAG: peptidoglycan DD-metalloendopeptidase family protein [Paraclostridium sp.]